MESSTSADLNAAEQCIDRLKAAEAERNSYKRLYEDALVKNALLERLNSEVTTSRDHYRKEAEIRAAVNAGDTADRILAAKVESLMRDQFNIMREDRDAWKAEAHKARNPGWLKSLFDPKVLITGAAGFGLGTLTR